MKSGLQLAQSFSLTRYALESDCLVAVSKINSADKITQLWGMFMHTFTMLSLPPLFLMLALSNAQEAHQRICLLTWLSVYP